ncbi:hypothetical protein ACMAZF_10775 [Psychrobium sp. nBUS_13]|uniref:hypothetical protein n=1 Tax=Psychrobium sp. nBUS_13 TaxID=3395319 RepID=UPI003EB697C8
MKKNNSKTWINCCYTTFFNVNPKGIKLKTRLWWFSVAMISLSGCSPPTPPIPQEGDIATWRAAKLIVRAELGQRRTHVVKSEKYDNRLHAPAYEKFIGQFPIDYVPKQFPRMAQQEFDTFVNTKRPTHVYKRYFIEFYLMLNGATSEATDNMGYKNESMDDPNQVRVIVKSGYKRGLRTTTGGMRREALNSRERFEIDFFPRLDISTKKTEYGMDCYGSSRSKTCFGESEHPLVSGFFFTKSAYPERNIRIQYQEFIYGGIKVEAFTDRKNFRHIKEIDTAIWRLLDAWNVAPLPTNNHF